MAKMNGCNADFENMNKAQGKGRISPSTFARNNLSMGGVNGHVGGTKTSGAKLPLGRGKANMNTK